LPNRQNRGPTAKAEYAFPRTNWMREAAVFFAEQKVDSDPGFE